MERRKFPRVEFDGEVRYKIFPIKEGERIDFLSVLNDKSKFNKIEKKNISGGGICVISDKEIPVKTLILVNMILPEFSHPIFVVGEVMWNRKVDEKFEIGIKFQKIAEEDRFKITSFAIDRVLKDER